MFLTTNQFRFLMGFYDQLFTLSDAWCFFNFHQEHFFDATVDFHSWKFTSQHGDLMGYTLENIMEKATVVKKVWLPSSKLT